MRVRARVKVGARVQVGSATLPGSARPRAGRAEKRVRAPTKASETPVRGQALTRECTRRGCNV